MTLKLPPSTHLTLKSRCRALRRNPKCTARQLAALIGLLSFSKTAISPAPLFYRSLQFALILALRTSGGSYNKMVSLGEPALLDLQWWITNSKDWNATPILRKHIDCTMQTDASLTGWGVVHKDQKASGLWSQRERLIHINALEMKAYFGELPYLPSQGLMS